MFARHLGSPISKNAYVYESLGELSAAESDNFKQEKLMSIIKGHFDDIHLPECKIESFEIAQDSITVNIKKGLEIYPPHPLAATSKFDEPCKLLFKGVIFSKRVFNQYNEGQEKGYKQHLFHEEFNQKYKNVIYSEYFIEGLLIKPLGWVEWDITAAEFYVDDLKN